MAGNRVILASETNDDRHVELDKAVNGKITVPVTLSDTNGNPTSLASGLVAGMYDNMTLAYTGSQLDTVTYKLGTALVAIVTLGYDLSGNLTSVIKT